MPKPFKGRIELDVRDSTPDWDASLPDEAPEGALNILVVLYDDTGQAAWSPFTGGEIRKVVFDVADDAYVDVKRTLTAAMAWD
jgi:arylsulfatase